MSMDDHDKVEAKVVDDDDDDDEAGELSTAPVVVAQECLHTEPLEKSVQEMVDEPGHDVKEETDAGVVGTAELQPVSQSTQTEESDTVALFGGCESVSETDGDKISEDLDVEEDRNVAETKVTSNDESETILTAADTASDGGDFSRDEQRTMDPLAPRILFDDSLVKVQAFVDSGEPGNCKINDQWKSKTEKVLKFDAPVYRVSPAKYFWSRSRSEYEKRILAVYSNPDIILVLRYPRCEEEVRRLITPDRPRNDISYLIVESVVDSSSCKLRLSRLTHATAIPSKPVSDKDSPIRRQTSFEIITPTEIIELSAVNRSHDAPDSAYANKDAFNCTLKVQNILTDAIVNVFGGTRGDENHWKHQVVLGTPHSYVLRNEQTLQQSLSSALEIQKSRHKTATSQNKLDCTTIDSREDGQTALHLACIQQKSKMVQLLVDAGADCSIPQLTSDFDDFTPCHLCANCLDYKTLSILLSSTYPARPDPNSLDARGRTPMYLAAVKGQGSDDALHLCLSALEAWGGQMTADSPDSRRLHQPLHIAASFWKHKRLSIILSHSGSYRYPLKTGVRAAGMSLGALHQYPIHAALISLRARLSSNGERDDINPNDLVNTITALLEHGFEPNERIEGTEGDAEDMNQYFGFAPLHILALTAKDVLALSNCSNSPEEVSSIQVCIKEGAQALLMRGARINLDPPPTSRLDRPVPPGCVSHGECPASSFAPEIGRKELRLDDDSVVEAFGGSEVVSVAQRAFSSSSRTVRNAGGLLIGTEAVDSDAPGGSDSESCAITWSEFGMITNRRHLCRTSLRWVANDDSTKRIVDDNGREHRISDGQYNLAVAEAQRVETKAAENRMAIARRQRQSAIDARESLGLQGARKQSSSGVDRENSDKTPSAADRISSAFSALGQARDAVLDRGDKLSSLQDKTEKLEQASLDFANMAKELNRSQNSWW